MTWKGTAEERQQWAIKKRREAEAAARKTGAEPLVGFEIAADQHRCDESTIEGFSVPPSRVACRVCGRTWTYSPTKSGWLSVTVTPLTEKCPSAAVSVSNTETNVASLPPAHLQGQERGAWWLEQQKEAA